MHKAGYPELSRQGARRDDARSAPEGLVMPEGMLVVAPRRVRPSHPTSASSSGCRPSSSQRLMPPLPWGPLVEMPAARDHVQCFTGKQSSDRTARC